MDPEALYSIIETLDQVRIGLYDVADEFYDEALDQINVDVLHTTNVVHDITTFLKTKLPDGFPAPSKAEHNPLPKNADS